MFRIIEGKGFHVTFKNGITVSVQIGEYNYCDNRFYPINFDAKPPTDLSCIDAEIAIWDEEGEWIIDKFTSEGDGMVAGYMTVEEVFDIIEKVRKY